MIASLSLSPKLSFSVSGVRYSLGVDYWNKHDVLLKRLKVTSSKLFVKEVWKESVSKDHWPSMKIAKRERTEGLAVIALSMLGCEAKPLSQIGRQALDMPLDVEFP